MLENHSNLSLNQSNLRSALQSAPKARLWAALAYLSYVLQHSTTTVYIVHGYVGPSILGAHDGQIISTSIISRRVVNPCCGMLPYAILLFLPNYHLRFWKLGGVSRLKCSMSACGATPSRFFTYLGIPSTVIPHGRLEWANQKRWSSSKIIG